MKKTILTIMLAAAAIVGCKKSSTPITFSAVTGGWSGIFHGETADHHIYWQIMSNGTISYYTNTSVNPTNLSGIGVYIGTWKFNNGIFTSITDSATLTAPHYYDTLKVTTDFKTMSGNERDTTGGMYHNTRIDMNHISN